jgi:hypothetical protein
LGNHTPGERIKVCVTQDYAERTWRIRYSEAEVTIQVWMHIDDLRKLAASTCADGKRELVS